MKEIGAKLEFRRLHALRPHRRQCGHFLYLTLLVIINLTSLKTHCTSSTPPRGHRCTAPIQMSTVEVVERSFQKSKFQTFFRENSPKCFLRRKRWRLLLLAGQGEISQKKIQITTCGNKRCIHYKKQKMSTNFNIIVTRLMPFNYT